MGKNILIYIDSMSPAGGIERVVSNLSNEWVKKHNITILTKDKKKSFYYLNESINVAYLDKPLLLNMDSKISRIIEIIKNIFSCHNKLKTFINKRKFDYIYTTNPINSLEIYLLGEDYRKKLIVSEHGSKLGYNKIYNFIKKIIYPKVYKVSVPTKLDTKLYLKEKNIPVEYMPHPCTFKLKEKNDLNKKIVLNVGRLTGDKQQLKLLEIWKNVIQDEDLNTWKLVIVGKGEYKAILENYINDNDLLNNVKLLDPVKEVENFYKDASIFLLTSKYEGFAMVLLEAMSFGLPCISFDCPSGPRDMIKNNLNGYLVKNDDLYDYISKLKVVMKNEDIRYRMGEEAFDFVRQWDNEEIFKLWDVVFEGDL